MNLSTSQSVWINQKKNFLSFSSYTVTAVLFLFISYLLLTPVILWNCPMMQHPDMPMISMSDMSNMPDMNGMAGMTDMAKPSFQQDIHKTDRQKTNEHLTHGIFSCPLCSGAAFSNPLLMGAPVLPALTFAILDHVQQPYQAQAPPVRSVKTTHSRAPPFP